METAIEKHWSMTVSDLQAWTCITLDCQMALCARTTFPPPYVLFGGVTCGVFVWNGGLTESTASVHYLHRALVQEEEEMYKNHL